MGLRNHDGFAAVPPWNYGAALAFVLGLFGNVLPAEAQQASQSGVDVRQLERRFEQQDSDQSTDGRRGVAVPRVSRSETASDPTPLFVLRNVSMAGAHAIPPRDLAAAWRPFAGKKVSQADLVTIATGIGDVYRAAGFHLSRAIVPPQDIADGAVRIQVIEGSITDVVVKGEGVERFGIRALLAPVAAEQPSRLATLERQLMLVNARPGVRIIDTQLEEIGTASGHFRLVISVQTWDVYAFAGLDNLGSSAVGPWQSYATAAYNSHDRTGRHARAQSRHHAGRSAPASLRPAVLRHADRRRRVAGRRLRPLQRSVARRLAAAVCRQHQDRSVRSARQHCAADVAANRA